MTLREIAPKVSAPPKSWKQTAILDAIEPVLDRTLAAYGIDTPLRRAHFLAQIAHESDGFCTTEEYASGAAYEGREDLGNILPGDGRRYKGRGLIQLTGRYNYARIGPKIGVDLESFPEKAADPVLSLEIACFFWKDKGLNRFADEDDIEAITRRINGGLNGLADRKRYLERAKKAGADKQKLDRWDEYLAAGPSQVYDDPPPPEPKKRLSWGERILRFFGKV